MPQGDISADDRAGMIDVLGRYVWAVDTGDVAAVVACFSNDGLVRYGTGERYEGQAGLTDFARRAIGDAGLRDRMHLNHPLYFRLEDGHPVLRSYMVPVQIEPMPPHGPIRSLRYTDDTFVRTGSGWRIGERAIYLWQHAPHGPQG